MSRGPSGSSLLAFSTPPGITHALDTMEADAVARMAKHGITIVREKPDAVRVSRATGGAAGAQAIRAAHHGCLTLAAIWATRDALSVKDAAGAATAALAAGMRYREFIFPSEEALSRLMVSASQRARAKRPRRPGLPKRAVMLAMRLGYSTRDTVESYLHNSEDVADDWGELGIDFDGEDFIIRDFDRKLAGEPKSAALRPDRIGQLISEIKNSD